jgi:hypothetical protein
MYSIIGGAGGNLDYDRVDNWNMYQKTEINFHFVTMDIFQLDEQYWELKWEMLDVNGKPLDHTSILSKPPLDPIVTQPQSPIVDAPRQPQLDENTNQVWDLTAEMDWDLELAAENE